MSIISTKQMRLRLIDAFRIINYENFKSNNIDSDLKGLSYGVFDNQWQNHNIYDMSLEEIYKLMASLGYSEQELMDIRNEYYEEVNLEEYEED